MKQRCFSILLVFITINTSAQYISFHNGAMFTSENKLVSTDMAKEMFNEAEFKEFRSAQREYTAGVLVVGGGAQAAVLGLAGMGLVYMCNPYVFDLMNGKREYEDWMNRHATGGMVLMEVLTVGGLAGTALGLFPTIHGRYRLKRFADDYNSKQSLQFQVSPFGAGFALVF